MSRYRNVRGEDGDGFVHWTKLKTINPAYPSCLSSLADAREDGKQEGLCYEIPWFPPNTSFFLLLPIVLSVTEPTFYPFLTSSSGKLEGVVVSSSQGFYVSPLFHFSHSGRLGHPTPELYFSPTKRSQYFIVKCVGHTFDFECVSES